MTLPNGADGLSGILNLAFPLTADPTFIGDDPNQRLSVRDLLDQPTVEEILKDEIRSMSGWQNAHAAGFAGLPFGIPFVLGIAAMIAEKITGLPISRWIDMWNANPIVANLAPTVEDAFDLTWLTSANIQTLLGSLDFTDPDFDIADAAPAFINTVLIPTNMLAALVAGVLSPTVIPGLDTAKIITGTFAKSRIDGLVTTLTNLASLFDNADFDLDPGSFDPLETFLLAPSQHAQEILDPFVQFLGGLAGSYFPTSDYAAAAENTAATIASTAAAVAAMQQQLTQGSTSGGGLRYLHDFSLDADSTSIHSDFTRAYSGTQPLITWETKNGTLKWVVGGTGNRVAHTYLTSTVTTTDYQMIGVVWTAGPGYYWYKPFPWSTGVNYSAAQTIEGRRNAAGTSYVQLYMDGLGYLEFGYYSGGSYTALDSATGNIYTFPPGTYYLECGTSGNIRTFRLWLNNTIVWTYTDGAAVTPLGASNRGAGVGAYADDIVQSSPVAAILLRDNTPATVVGSTARFYRASTTGVNHTATTPANLANSFFDTTDYKTSDITWSPASANGITVSQQGNYLVTLRLVAATSGAQIIAPNLGVNGTVKRAGQFAQLDYGTIASWVVPLQAGDVVNPMIRTNGSTVSLKGAADGNDSAISITKIGVL